MDNFAGTYEWARDDNFEEALAKRALPDDVRKMMINNKPAMLTIKDNGDGSFLFESQRDDMKFSRICKLNEPFDIDVNGKTHNIVFTIWNNKLIQRRTIPDGATFIEFSAYFAPRNGDGIVLKTEARGMVGKRYFKVKTASAAEPAPTAAPP